MQRQHDPRVLTVEQRDRHRLLPGELVVGVVADQRLVGDGSGKRNLDARPGGCPVAEATSPTYSWSASKASCSEALWAITSRSDPSPSTSFWAARTRRTVRVSAAHASSASDRHRERCQRDDPLRVGQRGGGHREQVSRSCGRVERRVPACARPGDYARSSAPLSYFPKITRKVPLLFSTSVSPGTGSMLTGHARRGAERYTVRPGMSTFVVLPGSVLLIRRWAVSVLPSVVTDTFTLTFVSGLEPAFSTITVNVGFEPPLTWLSVGEGSSVFVPTLTPFSACPCVPGATAPWARGRLAGDVRLHGGGCQPAEVRQEAARSGALAADPTGGERLLYQWHHALRVDDVRGKEDLHRPRDLGARLLAWPPSASRTRLATFASPSTRRSSASSRLRCAAVISLGTLSPFARSASSCAWRRSWSTCTSTSSADLLLASESVVNSGRATWDSEACAIWLTFWL